MDRHQLCAVGKCSFDLYFVNHFGNTLHDLIATEQGGAVMHQFSHSFTIPSALQKRRGKVSDRFGMIQL